MRMMRQVRLVVLSGVLLVPADANAQAPTETVEYYALDAIGSVRIVFDASGTILGRMDYGPFGQELGGGTALPHQRFAGLFRDGEAGLDHAQARSYQVRTGRFSTVDPLGGGVFDPQGWNRYSYSLSSPVMFTDPSGLSADPLLRAPCENPAARAEFHCDIADMLSQMNDLGGGAGFGLSLRTWSGRGVNLGQAPTSSNNTGSRTPSPSPGPTAPEPAPTPTPPSWWDKTKNRMHCAADASESISLAYWLGAEGSTVGDVFLSNDIASLSNLITGPDRLPHGAGIAVSQAANMAAKATLLIKVSEERLPIRQDSSGNWWSTKTVGGPLGNTALGRALAKAGAVFSGVKLGYDFGTYAGALLWCGGR